jgi:hypothetical protein
MTVEHGGELAGWTRTQAMRTRATAMRHQAQDSPDSNPGSPAGLLAAAAFRLVVCFLGLSLLILLGCLALG